MALGRNDPCRCGSGKKYKKCCLQSDQDKQPEKILSAMDLSPTEQRALKDSGSDTGKMIHGSLEEPIPNPGAADEGGGLSPAPYIEWEYEHMAEVIGPYRKLGQYLALNAKKHHVDRLVVVDKTGVTHVFYFGIEEQFSKMGKLFSEVSKELL